MQPTDPTLDQTLDPTQTKTQQVSAPKAATPSLAPVTPVAPVAPVTPTTSSTGSAGPIQPYTAGVITPPAGPATSNDPLAFSASQGLGSQPTSMMPSLAPQAPTGPKGLPTTPTSGLTPGLAPSDRSSSMLETQTAPTFAPVDSQQTPTQSPPPVSDAAPMTTPAPTVSAAGASAPPQYTGPAFQQNLSGPSPFGVDAGVAGTSPLTGKTTQQINDYWGGQGAINPANLGLGTNATPQQIADATKQYQTSHAGDISAITKQVQGDQAANLAAGNQRAQTFDDNNQHAMDGALATALNSQQGYVGSGMNYADPNNPGKTIANPLDAAHTPTPGSQHPDATFSQNGPTSQGGTQTQTGGAAVPSLAPSSSSGPSNSPPSAPSSNLSPSGSTNGGATSAPNGGVSTTPTTADNSLINSTISPNNSVDRVKTFQDALNSTIKNVIDPSYDASARDLNRYNFGSGRGVSGEARTSQGDLADTRERRIADLSAQGLSNATTGSIDDLYKNIGIAQQQQGFQQDQQQTAFNQADEAQRLQDALTNSAFGRAQAQTNTGYANDPSQMMLMLSNIFGNNASAAGSAAAQLFGGMGNTAGQRSVNGSNGGAGAPGGGSGAVPSGGSASGGWSGAPWGYDANGEPLTQPPFSTTMPGINTTPSMPAPYQIPSVDANGMPVYH